MTAVVPPPIAIPVVWAGLRPRLAPSWSGWTMAPVVPPGLEVMLVLEEVELVEDD